MSDVSLDRSGNLDDLSLHQRSVEGGASQALAAEMFALGLSVASHQVLQLVGLITGHQRIGGTGPQSYHAYPGVMELLAVRSCDPDCAFAELTASAADQGPNIRP